MDGDDPDDEEPDVDVPDDEDDDVVDGVCDGDCGLLLVEFADRVAELALVLDDV